MSTRTEYQRSPGFGATRGSIKLGLSYEKKATSAVIRTLESAATAALLGHTSPDSLDPLTITYALQHPVRGGYVDIALLEKETERLLSVIEIKSQWSADAYKQLLRYGGGELSAVSRVCICKIHHPHVVIPEAYKCLQLADLLKSPRGKLTIIPWSGRA